MHDVSKFASFNTMMDQPNLSEAVIMDKKEEKYYTPILFRTGFLHDYWRTGIVLLVWFLLNVVTYFQMHVESFILRDPWTYMFFPLLAIVVYIARTAVSGYDDLFGIFDTSFEQNLRLYKSLNQPEDETENQERIKNIFRKNEYYEDFKKDVRDRLFGNREKKFLYVVIGLSPFIAILYYLAYLDVGVYGETGYFIWLNIYIISNLVVGFLILICLTSLVWIVFSMILSISDLEGYSENFKIAKYIDFLKGKRYESLDDAMGYDSFYEHTTAIGSFIYKLTLGALLILVAYALNLIFFSFLNQLEIQFLSYGIGLGIIISSIAVFVWPQLGLHNILSKRKRDILRELIFEKDKLDRDVMQLTIQSIESGRSKDSMDEISLKKETSERVENIYRTVKERTTWGFEISTLIQFLIASSVPLVTTMLYAFFEQLFTPP